MKPHTTDAAPAARLLELRTGRIATWGGNGVTTAIQKSVREGPVIVGREGISGDEQADRRFHGGPNKAIHLYPVEHYSFWNRQLATHFAMPGAFGENFVSEGMDEYSVCIGDVISIGDVILQVSQPRQPCWKLNLRFDHVDMATHVQKSGRTGWYFRILQTGAVRSGQPFRLIERPYPNWPLARLIELAYHAPLDRENLMQALELELPDSWQQCFKRRLQTGVIEDWTARLSTPASIPFSQREII